MVTINLNPAQIAAEEAQKKICDCLDSKKCFRVEAGAGAGKTHSLITALKYLIEKQGAKLMQQKQRVACITYTKVARDEIQQRIDMHPAIQTETIHSFCWSLIQPFQMALRKSLEAMPVWQEKLENKPLGNRVVEYNLGYRKVEEGKVLLHHDDVITLAVALLKEPKFQLIFAHKHPILFIDEYQDTNAAFAKALIENFVANNAGPVIGFFGDHWQKIFNGCGEILHENLEVIRKGSNFRSVPSIVEVLNRMRPDLVQAVTDPSAVGEANVFHTNEWRGVRLSGSHYKGDLPPEVSKQYLEYTKDQLSQAGWDLSPQKTKILMLTHNGIAQEQGYKQLADCFKYNEAFVKKEDAHIAFFADVIEPMCAAYEVGKYGEMFELIGNRRPTIRSQSDKANLKKEMDDLIKLRLTGTISDVLSFIKNTKFEIPNGIQRKEQRFTAPAEEDKEAAERMKALMQVPYVEVINLVKFLEGNTPFETQHGVKGAEFENVLILLGRGWNSYNFDQMLAYMSGDVPEEKRDFYDRNRNLFYVACSRPKKRLALLFTQELSPQALVTLRHLFGANYVHALPDQISQNI